MDQRRIGDAIRLVRRERRLRQSDVAARAGVSQSCVSAMEQGRLEELRLPTMRAIAQALEMTLSIDLRWRGSDLARLLDRDHAMIVESVVRVLRREGWEVVVEWSFNHFGERDSVDALAWHAGRQSLLVVEVKSRIVDVQDLLATLGRKARLVPALVATERGWHPRAIGRVIVLPDTTAARTIVSRHEATFRAGYPGRSTDARRWLRDPSGDLGAIWFLSDIAHGDGKSGSTRRVRVRKPRGDVARA